MSDLMQKIRIRLKVVETVGRREYLAVVTNVSFVLPKPGLLSWLLPASGILPPLWLPFRGFAFPTTSAGARGVFVRDRHRTGSDKKTGDGPNEGETTDRDNKGEEEAKWQAKRRGRQGDER